MPIVTFTSDFGTTDWFVGVVHGVVHDGCADARVVDLTHEVPPGDIDAGAFVLEAAAPDFPPGTVHLAVVDPGVGTSRLALAVAARDQWFVGPDNGLLEWALRAPGACVHALTDAKWLRQPVSRTFHARDVFAPVAAHLACGVALDRFGPAVPAPVRRPRPEPHLADDGSLTGCIVYLDRFGNALTDLTTEWLDRAFRGIDGRELIVDVLDRTIDGIRGSYGEAKIGALVALLGSSGRLEIAEVGGNASHRFGIGVRDQVRIRRR